MTLLFKLRCCLLDTLFHRVDEFLGILFMMTSQGLVRPVKAIEHVDHVPRLRVFLLEFDLMRCDRFSKSIKDQET